MQQDGNRLAAAELRVRLAADPASVPRARRFVADGLTGWGRPELVDDATLCVSELAGNAALHGASTFMEIVMRPLRDAVRISVEDDGATPAEAVIPRTGPADDLVSFRVEDAPTTGRGLAIVSVLATDWGVERLPRGKRVWADIAGTVQEHDVRPPTVTSPAEPARPGAEGGAGGDPAAGATTAGPTAAGPLPHGWALVRLVGCPVQLSLQQDQHLDELVRELQLIEAGGDTSPTGRELSRDLEALLGGPAHARHTGRRTAQDAATAGRDVIDVEMAVPLAAVAGVVALQEAVAAADRLCEDQRLLTLASPPDVRLLREWMAETIVDQARHGREPVSWTDWLAQRDRLG